MNEAAREPVVCFDGFEMSVQAGKHLYSTPREYLHRMGTREGDYEGAVATPDGYLAVEVGFPSEREPLLMPYVEGAVQPHGTFPTDTGGWDTVYPYVPVDVVYDVIIKHGGLASSQDTLPPMEGIIIYSDDEKKWPSMFAPDKEADTFRLARMTMAEQLHAKRKNAAVIPIGTRGMISGFKEEEKLLLFPGMKLPEAWVWKRDAQGLTRKATNWKTINYPTGMDFLAWQAIWGDAIL